VKAPVHSAETSFTEESAKRIFRTMLLIRRFEEAMIDLYRRNLIPGFIHPGIGEEAVHVGVCDHLRPSDSVVATHRGHGQALAKGVDPDRMMAEVLGRATGVLGGRGGSLHVGDWAVGCLPASPLVGGGIATMTGIAFAHQHAGQGNVAVCFFGDGALNRGAFHEAVNMASIWRLPIVYACIDNGWAISVPRSVSTAGELVDRARAYGMAGAYVDGKDIAECHSAAAEAIQRARAGRGPTVLFFDCPRGYGHEEGDAQEYRDKLDYEQAKDRDPLSIAAKFFAKRGLLSDDRFAELESEVVALVDHAVTFAINSPPPQPDSAFEGVRPYTERSPA
jgi:acetoin:2,6-dichlorophenolindophenol oxidoreductase subunit alpha